MWLGVIHQRRPVKWEGGGEPKGDATNLKVGALGAMHWQVVGQYSKNNKIRLRS